MRSLSLTLPNGGTGEQSWAPITMLVFRDLVVREHKNILIQSSVDNVEESYRLQFSNWISKRVTELYNDGKVSKQMLSLARVETNPRNAYEMTNDEIEPFQEAETQSQSMHAIQNDVEDNEID
ncbi:hypothetical protein GBA52_024988 [Prunus armeniaca]|nr:hypothetical protein GBA52_024988 [Prunus armeniaca]